MNVSALTSRLLARNTAYNLLGQAAPLLVAVIALPLVVHELGPARFGLLALGWMILGYVGELGFGRATTKFVAEALGRGELERVATITWGTLLIQLAIGLIGGVALALLAPLLVQRVLTVPPELHGEAIGSFRVLAAGIPVLLVASAIRGVLEAAQRFGAVNAVRAPASAALYLLPLAGVALGMQLPGILGLMLLARLLMAAAYAWIAVRQFPVLLRPRLFRSELGGLLSFGSWAAVSSLASPILMYLDRFVLGALLTVAAVGYYTPAFELAVRMGMLPAAVVATMFPAFSMLSARQDPERLQRLVGQSIRYVLLGLGPFAIVLMAGARDLLHLWLGAEFAAQGALALQILVVGVLINGIACVPFTLIQAVGRPDVAAKLHLVELPLHGVMTYIFVSRWGIPGAALAWTVRVTLDAALLFWAAARLRSLSLGGLLAGGIPQTAAVLVACATGAMLLASLTSDIGWRLALLAAGFSAVVPLLWRFGLGAADRATIRGLIVAGSAPQP
jgi:O-antigen/teichoic acid export membrane protein